MDGVREYQWKAWPVAWSSVWIGALAALVTGLIIGLIGYAVGAHEVASPRPTDAQKLRMIAVAFNIAGSFFAFVIGGWIAVRIAGMQRAEPAMMHGAIVWLLGVSLIVALAGTGGAHYFGSWYGGLAGPATRAAAVPIDPETARIMRNAAFGTVVGLLVGLVGGVLGAWMACGEPMSIAYYRRRWTDRYGAVRRAA
jgi:ABC-type Fe3+ transport system permease subunit